MMSTNQGCPASHKVFRLSLKKSVGRKRRNFILHKDSITKELGPGNKDWFDVTTKRILEKKQQDKVETCTPGGHLPLCLPLPSLLDGTPCSSIPSSFHHLLSSQKSTLSPQTTWTCLSLGQSPCLESDDGTSYKMGKAQPSQSQIAKSLGVDLDDSVLSWTGSLATPTEHSPTGIGTLENFPSPALKQKGLPRVLFSPGPMTPVTDDELGHTLDTTSEENTDDELIPADNNHSNQNSVDKDGKSVARSHVELGGDSKSSVLTYATNDNCQVNQKFCLDTNTQEIQPQLDIKTSSPALKAQDTFSMSLFSQDDHQDMLNSVSVREKEQTKLNTSGESRKLGVNVALSDFFDPPSRAVGKRRCAPSRGKKRKSVDEETLMLDVFIKQNDSITFQSQKKCRHANIFTSESNESHTIAQNLSQWNSDVCLDVEGIDSTLVNKKFDLPISKNNIHISASKLMTQDPLNIDTSTPINYRKKHKTDLLLKQAENSDSWTDSDCYNSTPVNSQKKLKSILSSEKKDRSSSKKKQVRFALQTKSSLKRNCRKLSDTEQTFNDEWMDNGGVTDQEGSLLTGSKIPLESTCQTRKCDVPQKNESDVKLCNGIDVIVHKHVISGDLVANVEDRSNKTPELPLEITDDLFSQMSPSALIDMCEAASSDNRLNVAGQEENRSNKKTSEKLKVPGKLSTGLSRDGNFGKNNSHCEELSTKRETEISHNKIHSTCKHLSLKSNVTRFLYPTTKQISTSCPKTVYAFAEQSHYIQTTGNTTPEIECEKATKSLAVKTASSIMKNVSMGQNTITSQNDYHRPRKVTGFESFSSMVDCSTNFKDDLVLMDERMDTRPRNVKENLETTATSQMTDKTELDISEQIESVHKLDSKQANKELEQNKELAYVDVGQFTEDERCASTSTSVTLDEYGSQLPIIDGTSEGKKSEKEKSKSNTLQMGNLTLGYKKDELPGIAFNTASGKKVDVSPHSLDLGGELMKDTIINEASKNINDLESLHRKDEGCQEVKMPDLTNSLIEYNENGISLETELVMSAGDGNYQPIRAEGLQSHLPSNTVMDGTSDKTSWNFFQKQRSRELSTTCFETSCNSDCNSKQLSDDKLESVIINKVESMNVDSDHRIEGKSTGALEASSLNSRDVIKHYTDISAHEYRSSATEPTAVKCYVDSCAIAKSGDFNKAIGSTLKPDDDFICDLVTDAENFIPGNCSTGTTNVTLSAESQVDENTEDISAVVLSSSFPPKSYDALTDNKCGFKTVGGKSIQISDSKLKKAADLIENVDENLSKSSFRNPEVNCVNTKTQDTLLCDENLMVGVGQFGGFSTAGGRDIQLNRESMRKAMSLIAEVNAFVSGVKESSVTNNQQKKCDILCDVPLCDSAGIQAVSGKTLILKEENSSKVRKVMPESLDSVETLEEMNKTDSNLGESKQTVVNSRIHNASKTSLTTSFSKDNNLPTGFSTASGSNIRLSNESLRKAKALVEDCQGSSVTEGFDAVMKKLSPQHGDMSSAKKIDNCSKESFTKDKDLFSGFDTMKFPVKMSLHTDHSAKQFKPAIPSTKSGISFAESKVTNTFKYSANSSRFPPGTNIPKGFRPFKPPKLTKKPMTIKDQEPSRSVIENSNNSKLVGVCPAISRFPNHGPHKSYLNNQMPDLFDTSKKQNKNTAPNNTCTTIVVRATDFHYPIVSTSKDTIETDLDQTLMNDLFCDDLELSQKFSPNSGKVMTETHRVEHIKSSDIQTEKDGKTVCCLQISQTVDDAQIHNEDSSINIKSKDVSISGNDTISAIDISNTTISTSEHDPSQKNMLQNTALAKQKFDANNLMHFDDDDPLLKLAIMEDNDDSAYMDVDQEDIVEKGGFNDQDGKNIMKRSEAVEEKTDNVHLNISSNNKVPSSAFKENCDDLLDPYKCSDAVDFGEVVVTGSVDIMFQGFKSASGKRVQVSNAALANAQKCLSDWSNEDLDFTGPPSYCFKVMSKVGSSENLLEDSLRSKVLSVSKDSTINTLSSSKDSGIASADDISMTEKSQKFECISKNDFDISGEYGNEDKVDTTLTHMVTKYKENKNSNRKNDWTDLSDVSPLQQNTHFALNELLDSQVEFTQFGKDENIGHQAPNTLTGMFSVKATDDQQKEESKRTSFYKEAEKFSVLKEGSSSLNASGSSITVSEKVLQQARKNMENIASDMSPFQSASGKSVSVSEKALQQVRKNMENIVSDMSPFQSASGNFITVSEKALQQARKNMENIASDMSPFQSASGNFITVSEKALQQVRKNMENIVSDMSPFQSASGSSITVSEKALQQARKNMENIASDMSPFQSASGNFITVSEKALQQARKNMENIASDMSPFQSASGNFITVSEKALQQARKNMENIASDMSPFQSASGKSVSVSEKALQQARKNMENIASDISPFQSASGKSVSVSEKALQQSRKSINIKTDLTISKGAVENVKTVFDQVQENTGGTAMEMPPNSLYSDIQCPVNKASNDQGSNPTVKRKVIDKTGPKLLATVHDCINSKSSEYIMQTQNTNKLKEKIPKGFNLTDRTFVSGFDQDLEIFYQPDDFLEEMEIPSKRRKLDRELELKNAAVAAGKEGFLTPLKSTPEALMTDRLVTSHSLKPLRSPTSQTVREKSQLSEQGEIQKQIMTQPVKAVFKTPYKSRSIQNGQNSCNSNRQTLTHTTTPTYIPHSFAKHKTFQGGILSVTTGSGKEKFKVENGANNVNDSCVTTAVDVVAKILDSRKYQEELIQKKEETKIRPTMGRLLEMKSQKCRIKLKDVIDLHCKSSSEMELLRQGVEKSTFLVKAGNASKHVFHLPDFYSGFQGHVYVGDGAFLVPDDRLNAGKKEFFRAFLTVEGVDGKLISEAWFYNHYRWVIWKLASYEIVSPGNFAGRSLNPEVVMLQLKYRYDREIDKCQRSALKKIMERDDTASKRMVLCVSHIYQSQTDAKNATSTINPVAAEKQDSPVNMLDTQPSVELTDGWYSIVAILDVPLQDLVNNRKIKQGDKLCISGAELLGSRDACSPLEVSTNVMLKLNANSTRPVSWDTKLGYQTDPRPLCVPLTKLYGEGGAVGCLDVVIARKYPVMFMERLPDGSCVFRSHQAEEHFQRQHEQHRQVEMEQFYNKLLLKFEKEEAAEKCISMKKWTKKEVEHLQTGQEIYEAYNTCRQPEILEEYLCENQMSMLMAYKQQIQDDRCQKLQREFQKTWQSQSERNVVPLLKMRIVGCTRKDLDEKASTILSVWRPSPNILDLKEGERYKIYGLMASTARSRYCQHDVQLSANRQTRFHNLKVDENLLDMMYEPREVMGVNDVRCRRSMFGEVDFVGIVVSISSIDFADSCKHQEIVYAADSQGDVLGIKFWGGFKNHSSEVLLTEGCIFCGTNLIDKSFLGSDIPLLEVSSEFTSLTQKPKYPSQRLAVEKLQAVTKNKKEFIEKAKQHLEQKQTSHTVEKLQTDHVINAQHGASPVSIPSLSPVTPEGDKVEKSKRSAYQTKMAHLLNYGSPSPLAPIPSSSSRKVNKAFKSPLVPNT